jgi:hypothetical protein
MSIQWCHTCDGYRMVLGGRCPLGHDPALGAADPVCERCEGERYIDVPVCRGGSDHVGFDCGGLVCGSEAAPCPACQPCPDTYDLFGAP